MIRDMDVVCEGQWRHHCGVVGRGSRRMKVKVTLVSNLGV